MPWMLEAKAASAVAQTILTNMLTRSHSSRGTRAAELESCDGSRDKAEQFVLSVHIAITMQLNMFAAKRMKILYALSFMHGGIAQVWAENKTNTILSHSSTFSTLSELLAGIVMPHNTHATSANESWLVLKIQHFGIHLVVLVTITQSSNTPASW